MRRRFSPAMWLAACAMGIASFGSAHAGEDDRKPPVAVPYFASLKRPVANVRVGPGIGYPIRWVYRKRGVPVEVIATYGNWRRIRSSDGQDGWINQVLLSAGRTALVSPWSDDTVNLRSGRNAKASVIARLQPRVLVRIHSCDRTWCAVSLPGRDSGGYVRQAKLWGVYPDEMVKDKSLWAAVERLL